MTGPSPRRKSVVLVITENCNLKCSYCYEAAHSRRSMPLDIARQALDRHLNEGDFDEVEVDFHGGEPFLNFELMKQLSEWTWARTWSRPLIFFATTNGTLVHGEIQTWLTQNARRFWCGLSLDGTPEMHNRNRSNSSSRIDVDFFLKTWPHQPVKMTVSPTTLSSLAEGVIYLHERGFSLNCNLAAGLNWEAVPAALEKFSEQLRLLVNYYLDHPKIAPCNLLDIPLRRLAFAEQEMAPGFEPAPRWCGIGRNMVAVDVEGGDYPCQVLLPFAGAPSAAPPRRAFDPCDALRDPRCGGCRLEPLCPTCYASNHNVRGNLARRDATECQFFGLRARASAYMLGEMLTSEVAFSALDGLDENTRSLTARGVLEVDEWLQRESEGLPHFDNSTPRQAG